MSRSVRVLGAALCALLLLTGVGMATAATAPTIVREPPDGAVIIDKVFVGDVTLVDDATITIRCEQVPDFGDGVFEETVTIPAGTVQLDVGLTGIPAPSDCVVEEVDAGSSEAADVGVVGLPAEFRLNPNEDYQLPVVNEVTTLTGSLAVVKIASGDAAALRDDVVVEVVCTDPGGTTRTVTLDLVPGRPVTGGAGAVIAGSTCTVTEVDDGAPAGVDVVTSGSPKTVTVGADELEVVVIGNTYTAQDGTVELVKQIVDPDDQQVGDVSIDLVCDGTVVTTLVVPAGAGTGTYSTSATVPAGQQCTAVETADGVADGSIVTTSVSPPGLEMVTAGETTTITVTNTYEAAPPPSAVVTVDKQLTGDLGRQGPVMVIVDCGGRRGVIALAPGATSGGSVTVTDVDPGETCTVEEPLDGDNAAVSVTTVGAPSSFAAADGSFTVENDYELATASLRVVKAAVGDAAGDRGPVTIAVACTDGSSGSVTTAPGDAFDDLVVTGIADGASCTVTEPVDGSSDEVAVVTAVLPRVVSVTAGEEAVVLVANEYAARTGTLVVATALRGNAEPFRDTVVVRAACEGEDPRDVTVPVGERARPVVIGDLPYGATCTVTQLEDGDTPAITTSTTPAASQEVTIAAPVQVLGVVTTYTADPGSLTVTKLVTGTADGRDGIVLEVVCDGVTQTVELEPTAGSTTFVVEGLVPGATCEVTEPVDGTSDVLGVTTSYDPGATVVVGPGAAEAVTVTNDYRALPVVGRDVTGLATLATSLVLLGMFLLGARPHRRG